MSKVPYKIAINAFERAVKDLAWMGSQHPDDHAHIESTYRKAKDKLLSFSDLFDG